MKFEVIETRDGNRDTIVLSKTNEGAAWTEASVESVLGTSRGVGSVAKASGGAVFSFGPEGHWNKEAD